MMRIVSEEGGGWSNNNVLWTSYYVSARTTECENSLETLSSHRQLASRSEQWTEYQWDFFSSSFFYTRRNQDRGRLGRARISELWKMVLLVFWQSSSRQEQWHLMLLESHSTRKGLVSLNGNFSKEVLDVPSRKLLCHLSALLRIRRVKVSPTIITRPL